MRKFKKVKLAELMTEYETALAKYGLGFAARLRLLHRAASIANKHERQGKEYLDGETVADYFRDIDERFYNGEITKDHSKMLYREAERLLWFAETAEIKLPNPQQGSRQTLTTEYTLIAEKYLSLEMHPNTRNDARWVTHKYFSWLAEQGHDDLTGVGSGQIQKFLLDCVSKMSMNSIHDIKIHLAKLYAHLYETGQSQSSYQALLSFKVNRESKIRPTMTRAEIAKVIDKIDRRTFAGKRAYAVMILGVVLGLRACDVANLKLGDIDWVNGEIKILQQKTAETVVLPLTKDVGEALRDYILNARPKTDAKHIFIKLLAPFKPMKSAVTIGEIFRDCCKTAGLDYGKQYHILRRSLGTSLVNTGTPVTTVAQILGHADIESAKKYIAVDCEHLKLCALTFDGIAPIGGVFCE
jgi:integrase